MSCQVLLTWLYNLLNELVIHEDLKAGECQGLGDIETGDVSLLGSSRESELLGVITPVSFSWDCCWRKELR